MNEITLVQTCEAFPEQYDAFIAGKQVGYLRLRGGYFCARYPDVDGEVIYEVEPDGSGFFLDYEREKYLEQAKQAIMEQLRKEVE